MIDIIEKYNVSRETIANLKTFQNTVLEWNLKFNLISKSTEKDIWLRHIIDSLQLIDYIAPQDKILYDFGSGAGFPAIVLAIAAKEKFPDLKISLVESIRKKVLFLEEVKKALSLDIEIINNRIENIKPQKADVITSRALASLDKLLEYSKNFSSSKTKLIFPKGEKWQEEVEQAKKHWSFEYETKQSLTSEKGCILYIKNARRK